MGLDPADNQHIQAIPGQYLPRSCYSTRPVARLQKLSLKTTPGELTHEEYKEFIAKLKKHKFSHLVFRPAISVWDCVPRWLAHLYTANVMDTPTRLHKLTVLSQLLDRLRTHTLDAQNAVIKAAGEEDLRLMLLNRYPLRLNSVPDTMAGVIRELEELLPDVKRIIEI